jgi:auxin-responsive protein IAA
MMNLVSFETPPLGTQERVHATTCTTTTIPIMTKDASSRSAIFDDHLDLSLGMSMSGGGGVSNATKCSGVKMSHWQANRSSDEDGCISSGVAAVTPAANTLRAGHGHVADLKAGAGWTLAFLPSPTGFMHPWSLAARQQKAAAEQDRKTAAAYMPR